MTQTELTSPANFDSHSEELFGHIASDLLHQGHSVLPNALPEQLALELLDQLHKMDEEAFERAGIGRDADTMLNRQVRNDQIAWISGSTDAGRQWLHWSSQLQTYLNRRLFLGLFSFESHFAHYPPGHFYKRHYDAFKGDANRVLSLVVYLNKDWQSEDGGEMVLFQDDNDLNGTKILPELGTVAVFLSEEFPHEVLPAMRDRYSIAGWFRVNSSNTHRVDPPA